MSVKKYLDKLPDLKGKEIIITGGTSGIGLAIVHHLLYKGAKVVILARNLTKAEEVKTAFLKQFEDASIDIVEYDQSKEDIIVKAVNEVNTKHPKFDAIILNAGVFALKNKGYRDGDMSLTIKTNYYGLYLFCKHLLESNTHPHRFIFQGSLAAGLPMKKISSLYEKIYLVGNNMSLQKVASLHCFITIVPHIKVQLLLFGRTGSHKHRYN